MRNVRFVLIEKDSMMSQRLVKVIENVEEFSLVGAFANLKSAEAAIKENPNVVLLDIDDDDIDEIVLIRQCKAMFAKADIICLGRTWEEVMAAILFKNGCKGYMAKPFSEKELIRIINSMEKSSIDKLCSVSAFFSPKGKMGRTTLIANLAATLSTKWEQRVLVIDADVHFSDLSVFFNVEPTTTIVEASRDANFLTVSNIEEYFTAVNENLNLLAGTISPEAAEYVTPESLAVIIQLARKSYQFILIDLPPAFNPMSIAAMEEADNVFLVSMINGTYEMENAQRSMEIFKCWEDFNERVNSIFTRVWPYTEKERLNLEEKLGYPLCLIVPNAYTLISSTVNSGVMAVVEDPKSEFAESVATLANRLCHRLGVR